MKELPKTSNSSILGLLAVLAAILANSALAVTYTGSLPLTPVHPRYAFGGFFDVGVNSVLLDADDIDDDEYAVIAVEQTVHWAVRDSSDALVAELDGAAATVTSSLPGGNGFIYAPGEYTITFTGSATYYLARMDGVNFTMEGPYTVTLTPCEGGRLTMPFTFVGVGSVSCGGVTSTTATPGTNETLVVPVGYNNGTLTLTAAPTPSGAWPPGQPVWANATATVQNPSTATLSTATAGTYNVMATCGNTVAMTVQVVGVSGITARRKGTGDSFGSTATIAAGGKNTDVHKAEIKVQLSPSPLKQVAVTVPASLSGAAAHAGTNVAAVLSCGNSSIAGNSSGTITLTDIDTTTGSATAILTSSNVTRTCTVNIGGQSLNVTMAWDISGIHDFEFDDYFLPDMESDVIFYPTLDEIALLDEDEDGTPGEGAIGGHDIVFHVTKVTFDYWSFDYDAWEYVDEGGVVELDVMPGSNPILRFGVRLDDLLEIDDVTEAAPGKYVNPQTVYYYYNDTGTVIECIAITEYEFDAYDMEVYLCE